MTIPPTESDPALEATQAADFSGKMRISVPPGADSQRQEAVPSETSPTDATVDRRVPAAVLTRFGSVDFADETTPENPGRYVYADGDPDSAEIGRGGIGRVMLAFDRHLRREVAIKELRVSSGDLHRLRFMREARVTGQLEHPGVVPVYELGHRADGTPYYVMRLVRGKTLKEALRECRTPEERIRRHLSHFVQLCQTIAYAHSRGVIHRDIKPENVMIGEFGETVVLDWGLARPREAGEDEPPAQGGAPIVFEDAGGSVDSSLTQAGDFLGTPAYMAPEQARGDIQTLCGCADVWSLGAVLYELLTGRPPHVDDTLHGLLMKALSGDVTPPDQVAPDIPADLASICMKALSPDPRNRYASARDLAEEIEAFRAGRRVKAHEYTPWEHLVRFAVQKKGLMISAALVLAVGIAALVLVSLSLQAEKRARRDAQKSFDRAEEARLRERTERLRAGLHFAQGAAEKAGRLFSERRFLSARIYAAASLFQNPASMNGNSMKSQHFSDSREEEDAMTLAMESRGQEWMARQGCRVEIGRLLDAGDAVNGAAFSPDGSRLAAVTKNGWLVLWNAVSGEQIHRLRLHRDTAWSVAFSPDGSRLAVALRDGRLVLLDAADGRQTAEVQAHPADAFAVAFHPAGDRVATGGSDGVARLWHVPNLAKSEERTGHDGAIHGLAFSPDGTRLATAGRDRTVRIFTLGAPESRVLEGHAAVVRHVAFSPDGTKLASASYDKTVRVWDAASGASLLEIRGHEDEVLHVAFSPDGRTLASSSWDRTLRLWDAASGEPLMTIDAHGQAVWGGVFSSSGRHLATASEDKFVRLWEIRPASPEYRGHGQGYLWSVAVSPDGTRVATAGADGVIRLWDAVSGQLERALAGHADLVSEVAFSPDGRLLASAGYDGTVRLWDAAGGPDSVILGRHGDFVRSVAFSPDGRLLASAGYDGAVLLWDVVRRAPAGKAGSPGDPGIRRVAFSPDGSILAAACRDGRVRLWEPSGRKLRDIGVGDEIVAGLAFSPDGRILAASDMAGRIVLADPASGNRLAVWQNQKQGIYTLRWFPDGERLLSTGDDRAVSVWERGTGRCRLLFRMGQSVMTSAVFPDGRRLVLADGVRAFAIPLDAPAFDADPRRLLEDAQRRAALTLSGFHLSPSLSASSMKNWQ